MATTMRLRQITRAVSDGTGLTPEEVWIVATVTVSVAALTGLLRAVDAVIRAVDSLRDG